MSKSPEKKTIINKQLGISRKRSVYIGLLILAITLYTCKAYKPVVVVATPPGPVAIVKAKDTVNWDISNVIPADAAIQKMKIEDGFEVKLVAAEPLIGTPVAITFDEKNRIWAVEMNGYMPDTLGTGEDEPTGKVVILEDSNNDGVADVRKVFLDSLLMPRALCLIEGGILVAAPPYLYFYEINGDKPGKRTLVDDHYTQAGNVEHFPNGLLRAMDNWIYNAKSDKRYRKQGDRWLIENTHFRGQWGITQDNYGRLYYNDNSTNLLGDYFLPGFGPYNSDQNNVSGYLERTVADNRVYPARPTPGVNRGYLKDVLDDSLRLTNFTAACGPLIYRGGLFGAAYDQNAFVAEPSANLIKRDILGNDGYMVKGKQAYKGKEFLTSTDERFRPVNLYNGPDGALYVVDMYRGIIQHKTYLTDYLKKQIGKRNLTQPLNCGRIYKIMPKGASAKSINMPADVQQLVALLGNKNGYLRDKAQQLLIDRKDKAAVPLLKEALKATDSLKVMHALWTLEGLHALESSEVLNALNSTVWPVRMQALGVIPSVINKGNYKTYLTALQQLVIKNDALAAPYIAYVCNYIRPFNKPATDELLKTLAKQYATNNFVTDAVISNLKDRETLFTRVVADTSAVFNKRLNRVIKDRAERMQNHDPIRLKKEFPKGAAIFASTCQTCHGADGNGIRSLAPPFNKSEWINGDKRKLISIVLAGLTGPVQVNGHLYQKPEINADMPGIGGTKEFTDADIAELLSYLRRSWQNNSGKVSPQEVTAIRTMLKGREKAFTTDELNKVYTNVNN